MVAQNISLLLVQCSPDTDIDRLRKFFSPARLAGSGIQTKNIAGRGRYENIFSINGRLKDSRGKLGFPYDCTISGSEPSKLSLFRNGNQNVAVRDRRNSRRLSGPTTSNMFPPKYLPRDRVHCPNRSLTSQENRRALAIACGSFATDQQRAHHAVCRLELIAYDWHFCGCDHKFLLLVCRLTKQFTNLGIRLKLRIFSQ